jgi:hypothetical protein
MAFFSHALLHDITNAREAADKPSLLMRVFIAMIESRRRQADREIARFVLLNGGKLTDSVELQIEQRFLPGSRGFWL